MGPQVYYKIICKRNITIAKINSSQNKQTKKLIWFYKGKLEIYVQIRHSNYGSIGRCQQYWIKSKILIKSKKVQ